VNLIELPILKSSVIL